MRDMSDKTTRLTDILTSGELTIDNVMVAWMRLTTISTAGRWDDRGRAHPDYSAWSRRYRCTDGACFLDYKGKLARRKLSGC